jgi:hypothetical protein
MPVRLDVRFRSQADICSAKRHVRFTPKSGHVRCTSACPLCAISDQSAAHQTTTLFDHIVGPDEQGRRDFETKRSGGSQVDHQIEPSGQHERQFANFFAL